MNKHRKRGRLDFPRRISKANTLKRHEGGHRAFEGVLALAEHSAKALTLFVATTYIIGYVITSARLARYSVPATRLIDAQYFAAGLLPGIFLWLMILVLGLALLYTSHKSKRLKKQ